MSATFPSASVSVPTIWDHAHVVVQNNRTAIPKQVRTDFWQRSITMSSGRRFWVGFWLDFEVDTNFWSSASRPAPGICSRFLLYTGSQFGSTMRDTPVNFAILFADVSGSMRLYEKLDDARALECIDVCMNIMREVTVEHGG